MCYIIIKATIICIYYSCSTFKAEYVTFVLTDDIHLNSNVLTTLASTNVKTG